MVEHMELFLLDHPRCHHSTVDEALDNHFHVMIEELHCIESHITDNVSDCCSELEHCIANDEQKMEARIISLEMAHSMTEAAHVDLLWQFDELKLELNRPKSGILDKHESTSTTLASAPRRWPIWTPH
jgi:hypothetical protein